MEYLLTNMANYTQITLGELLSSENETIKRNAVSILKVLQNSPKCRVCGLTRITGTREQTRDFALWDICIKCAKENH